MSVSVSPDLEPVDYDAAEGPLVLAVDVGSGSTRCGLFDGYARPIKGRFHRKRHTFVEQNDGTVEIDPNLVTSEVAALITQVVEGLEPGSVAAVSMDTFASSLICVDAGGEAISPCYTYADSRSRRYLTDLERQVNTAALHERTGVRLHPSYHPSRLLWLQAEQPEVFAATAKFLSLGEYVYAKLAGIHAVATATVAWSGMLNRNTRTMEEELLVACGVRADQFAPVHDPDQPILPEVGSPASGWAPLRGALWFPAIPDGYASNLGVGASEPTTAALSAATSGAIRAIVPGTPKDLPEGLWSYTVSRTHSIVGGALNDVGRVMLWMERTLAPVSAQALDSKLLAPPTEGTPLVLPFLTGERATGWAGGAKAIFADVSSSSTSLDLWRGACEGVAAAYARVFRELQVINPQIVRVISSGGASSFYPGLMDVITQALGGRMQVVQLKSMTLRGAAIHALSVLTPDTRPAPVICDRTIEARPEERAYYDDLEKRFEGLYDLVLG